MEELILSLVPSSPPRLISLSQVPELTPNNTAEMSAMIEALSFLGPHARLPRVATKHAAGVCLGTFKPAHVSSWHLRAREMNVLIMPPHLGHYVWYQVITYLYVWHVILLIPLLAPLPATTLVMSWRNC